MEAVTAATTGSFTDTESQALFAREQKLLDEMTEAAEAARGRPDARVRAFVEWIRRNACPDLPTHGTPHRSLAKWNDTRVLVFTEYDDTKRYLVQQLSAAIQATDRAEERIAVFHGPTPPADREAIYPRPRTTEVASEHRKFPYLLRDREITKPDEVWAADITYIPMVSGFMYLVAIIDWYSRYVLAWRLSNSLESSFCVDVLEEALSQRRPEIFNTDQGVQFTSRMFTSRLEAAGVSISMDGKGRALDNVFIERLWWSVKYEHVYLHEHATVQSLDQGLRQYLRYFNRERPHQSLEYHKPWDVYRGAEVVAGPKART